MMMTDYCLEHDLTINRCGKVVVTRNEQELDTLQELKRRGDINGVTLDMVDEHQLNDLEPNAKTFCKALYSPATSTVNPKEVVDHLFTSLKTKKSINILLKEAFMKSEDSSIARTRTQRIEYKYLINAAGLYADKIAYHFGVGGKYSLIPFKGLYLEYRDDTLIHKHVYPVPDINNPFLGTHFTKTANGRVKMGPTAIPAFWRENYGGFSNIKMNEFWEIMNAEVKLFSSNTFNFRKTAFNELKKYYKNYFIQQGSHLLKEINTGMFGKFLAPGIRAQLIDKEKNELVMDFVVEHGESSTHVLNAVSPAFTCAFSFSKYIVDEIEDRMN